MTKKIACALVAFLCLVMLWAINEPPEFNGYNGAVERYYNAYSSNCDINFGSPLLETGKAVLIEEDISLERVLYEYNAVLVLVEDTGNCVNYYAYSPKFKACKVVNGKMVNLHICKTEDTTKIGTPIIFGSF